MGTPSHKTVGILLYQGCTLLDFCGATQIFVQYASQGWTPVWFSDTFDPIQTSEGMSVMPQETFDGLDKADILFVPGGGGHGVQAAMENAALLQQLQKAAQADKWIGSVCTGTFVLAASGVLNGSTCTTHWMALDQLRRLDKACNLTVPSGFPRQHMDHKTKRFTGGGVSSSIDLALTLLRDLGSVSQANRSALMNQYAPKLPEDVREGQPGKADPKIQASLENDPKLQKEFLGPISAGVDGLLGQTAWT